MIKVTNSDLALHAGPVGRGMKNWDADDVMRELGLPILEYQEEPDYDSDLFAILCGIADVGRSKLGLGQANGVLALLGTIRFARCNFFFVLGQLIDCSFMF